MIYGLPMPLTYNCQSKHLSSSSRGIYISSAETNEFRHGMLLISARTLMSPCKKGLNGSLVCKNLCDPLTPIPVSKFEDKSGKQALTLNTTTRKKSLQILLAIATVLHKYPVKKKSIPSPSKNASINLYLS